MAKLVETEKVRLRGGFKDIPELLETLASYIEAATVHLARSLRVVAFDRKADNKDQFYIDSEEHPFITGGGDRLRQHGHDHHGIHHHQTPHGFPKLYLRNGFVDSGETITILRALNLNDFNDPGTLDDLQLTDIVFNFDKGTFTITDNDQTLSKLFIGPHVDREFIQVEYTSGFKTKSVGGVDCKLFKGHPDWLEEAAILQTLKLFGETGKCSPEDKARCKGLSETLPFLLEQFIRFDPLARKPLDYI